MNRGTAKIVAPGANATTYLTIIDVQFNIILMSIAALGELELSEFDADALADKLQPFCDEIKKQTDTHNEKLYGPRVKIDIVN